MTTRSVLFQTTGLIPIEAFTILGMNAKPKTPNPIGYFGTGLKYAVAVCARLGIPFRLFIGLKEYQFYAKAVYRELYANTVDEGGECIIAEDEPHGVAGETRIYIEGDEFYQVWEKRDEIFLPKDREPGTQNSKAEIYLGETRHLYWRGLRVYTLPGDRDKFMHTYNILEHIVLTEDRTMQYSSLVGWHIGKIIAQCDDEDVIQAVIEEKEDDSPYIERNIEFAHDEAPSEAFKRVSERLARRSRLGATSRSYGGRWVGSYVDTGGDFRTLEQRFIDNLISAYKARDHEDLADLMFSSQHSGFIEDMLEVTRRRAYGETTSA
ncbi:hypothetical protein GP486_008509 [Trichoglossum hirsutum]|uniref:Uncharacterized protein n=1 Tax=Trichoglossum hirsutum TaxID=265104 RepID=A0A9P8L5F0_9PEZI|nr:hypothetical protein GP486_008509 [Trichoglossum hirsutum]